MRFFDEKDFTDYQVFLMKSINETVKTLTDKDASIKAVLIGEFPDSHCRFVTVHPFSENQHVHHPEYDHYASLVMDFAPEGMSMFIVEANVGQSFNGTEESN